MYEEILKIKPKLDNASAKKAEDNLSKRFTNVSKKFGGALNKVMKGNILFLSLGLITSLLNPLKEVEERIKGLLGQGTDIKEVADKFNTTPGQIKRLQDVAQNMGVSPDRLYSMMDGFVGALDRARQEEKERIRTGEPLSETSKLLKDWMNESDLAEGFFSFIQSLQAQKGTDARDRAEREILGGVQRGSSQRFIDADFNKEFSRLGTPGVARTNRAIENLAKLDERDRRQTTAREGRSFIIDAEKVNAKMIDDMNKAQQREREREQAQMRGLDDLQKAKEGIDHLVGGLQEVSILATKAIGYLGELVGIFKNSRLVKYFTGGK